MKIGHIVLPALYLSKDGTLNIVHTKDEMAGAWAGVVYRGYYNDLLIVDSAGYQYVVEKATILDSDGWWWRFYEFFGNRRVRIELSFKDERHAISVAELQQLLRTYSKCYFAGMDSRETVGFRRGVRAATTIAEIIQWFVQHERDMMEEVEVAVTREKRKQ